VPNELFMKQKFWSSYTVWTIYATSWK